VVVETEVDDEGSLQQKNDVTLQLDMKQPASAEVTKPRGQQLTLVTGFTSLLERLMLSPYSPLISEVVSNAAGPYIRQRTMIKITAQFDKDTPRKITA
jgi:hypothetical protein